MIKCYSLFQRANSCLETQPIDSDLSRDIYKELEAVDVDFTTWDNNQISQWLPATVGKVCPEEVATSKCVYAWSGDVNSYLDLCVAAVWNTYRKTHLMVLEIMLRFAELSSDKPGASLPYRADMLATSIAASIPYHLSADINQYLRTVKSKVENSIIPPARPVGGLLLLHPLYVAARSSITPLPLRRYFNQCLAWIGQNMGIGQATLLSRATLTSAGYPNYDAIELPFHSMAEGHVLVWAGMLSYVDRRA